MPPCTRLLPCQEAAGSRGLEATPAPERLAAANAGAEVNTPAGGFSIETQRGTQLSTLLFIHDKLKSDLICGRRRTLNRRLEQRVYLSEKGGWSGSQGKAPVHRDNPGCLPSLQALHPNRRVQLLFSRLGVGP